MLKIWLFIPMPLEILCFRSLASHQDDKFKVNEEICGRNCWPGYQKCFDIEHENELIGVGVEKKKQDFRNCLEEDKFYCESCDFTVET